DDDLFLIRLTGFVFIAGGGVEIGRIGLELRRAGIDETVGGDDSLRLALGADGVFRGDVRDGWLGFGTRRGSGGLVGLAMDGNVVDGLGMGARPGDLAV